MEMDDIIIKEFIKKIGTSSFAVYCYVKVIASKKQTKIRLGEFMEILDLSKPTVIESLQILKKHKLISMVTEIDGLGKKSHFIKAIGKNSLPLSTTIYKYNKDNIIKTIGRYRDTYCYDLFKKIMLFLLKQARYNNKWYWNRCYKFTEKEKNHIENIKDDLGKGKIKKFLKWFLKEKSRKVSGLNVGLLASMVEEYKIKTKRFKVVDKKKDSNEKQKISKLQIEQAQELINDVEKGKKLNKIDQQFMNECLENKIIVVTDNGAILNV